LFQSIPFGPLWEADAQLKIEAKVKHLKACFHDYPELKKPKTVFAQYEVRNGLSKDSIRRWAFVDFSCAFVTVHSATRGSIWIPSPCRPRCPLRRFGQPAQRSRIEHLRVVPTPVGADHPPFQTPPPVPPRPGGGLQQPPLPLPSPAPLAHHLFLSPPSPPSPLLSHPVPCPLSSLPEWEERG
jgi:hypothetical protein